MRSPYNPFEEFEQMFSRMSRHVAEASQRWEDPAMVPRNNQQQAFPVDLVEEQASFVALVDLPGFDKEEVTISLQNETLHIEAEREETSDEAGEQYVRRERTVQSLHRVVHLPADVDEAAVTARMNNGVLTITLPKSTTEDATSLDIGIN